MKVLDIGFIGISSQLHSGLILTSECSPVYKICFPFFRQTRPRIFSFYLLVTSYSPIENISFYFSTGKKKDFELPKLEINGVKVLYASAINEDGQR